MLVGSDVMPDDDVTTEIGGGVETTAGGIANARVKVEWKDVENTEVVRVISETTDTTQDITVYGRTAGGAKTSEAISLNGTTPVSGAISFERLLKAVKSATCVGVVAVVATTALNSGTAVAGAADSIDLAAGSSATPNLYDFYVVYLDGGTGAGQIREIVYHEAGSNRRAHVRDWDTEPDGTTTYQILAGMVFEKTSEPYEIGECRRLAYDSAANPSGGAAKTYFDKFFVQNNHATLDATAAQLAEATGGLVDKYTFDVESSLNGTDTNGSGNNRQTEGDLSSYTFDSNAKDLGDSGDGNLTAGDAQGVWAKLDLAAGDAAQNSFYPVSVTGQST
jgi:hypothetical protein